MLCLRAAAADAAAAAAAAAEWVVVVSCSIGFAFWEATAPEPCCLGMATAALYEHLGRIDEALEWSTKKVDAGTDISIGGTQSPLVGLRSLCIKGRCLAAKEQMAEAEEALGSAAKQYGALGWYLMEGKSTEPQASVTSTLPVTPTQH